MLSAHILGLEKTEIYVTKRVIIFVIVTEKEKKTGQGGGSMNYLKKLGRFAAICFCIVCICNMPLQVHAMQVGESTIHYRMAYISAYGTELTISKSGQASVTGFVRGKSGVDNAYVKVTLQKKVSGTWTNVKSWDKSSAGRNASIAETYSVSKGTYRVYASIKAGTESKNITSAERTY